MNKEFNKEQIEALKSLFNGDIKNIVDFEALFSGVDIKKMLELRTKTLMIINLIGFDIEYLNGSDGYRKKSVKAKLMKLTNDENFLDILENVVVSVNTAEAVSKLILKQNAKYPDLAEDISKEALKIQAKMYTEIRAIIGIKRNLHENRN